MTGAPFVIGCGGNSVRPPNHTNETCLSAYAARADGPYSGVYERFGNSDEPHVSDSDSRRCKLMLECRGHLTSGHYQDESSHDWVGVDFLDPARGGLVVVVPRSSQPRVAGLRQRGQRVDERRGLAAGRGQALEKGRRHAPEQSVFVPQLLRVPSLIEDE